MLRLLSFCLVVSLLLACNRNRKLFEKIPSSHSGIKFNNKIVENDSVNPLTLVNVYNGGGVGIGDFNNDGLQDIYFTGNQVPSRLYLNNGGFRFEDITDKAGVAGMGRWARGVSVVDINNDGLMDIYVCNTVSKDSLKRRNILYINKGLDKDGVPHFEDNAPAYGLDIHVQSTMANFFDYDNDGDLDMYLTVNEGANGINPSVFQDRDKKDMAPSLGRLFRNDMDPVLKHSVFHDVSIAAGMVWPGYGHGATICDIDNDGWKDIYVSNDFLSDNLLYINNHNGTFTNRARDYFKHTSYNAMGQDVIDINNDGLADVVELDMNPKDNYRKKMMLASNNYNTFQNFEIYKYQFQYVRNTLQINQGPALFEHDSVGAPVFSEIAFMSGIAQTDWSWTPLVIDFDNDGYRDLIITNGFPKDVTDHDFIAYRQETIAYESPMMLLDKIPVVKLANYGFKNKDGINFNDVTDNWGLSTPSFSNGAAYADLDNDGDMDMVVNNIDDEAFIYENTLRKKDDPTTNFLQIRLTGSDQNRDAIGALVDIYYDGAKHQVYENTPYRGYLSTNQNLAHFGLGKTAMLDSVVITWPEHKKQTLKNVRSNQLLKINVADAKDSYSIEPISPKEHPLFSEVTKSVGIDYRHQEFDFIDFNVQTTLPHKFSEYCPALAVGDIDGNGLDDMVIGGNTTIPAKLFLQQHDGRFIQKEIPTGASIDQRDVKDEGLLLFDANGDGSLDLYIASGGFKSPVNSPNYQDRLYINDGKGVFILAKDALPPNYTSKLCVRAMDYNNDGKPDLFVSGRVDPGNYPKPVNSAILRNDSENGQVKFTDVTAQVAPDLKAIGMVCDALFTDFDNDNKVDLLLAGEWMPITFLKNVGGKFINVTSSSGIANMTGWWNSIAAGDFRHTGRTDYIVGNVGLNTIYHASEQYPVYITAKDFDKNGGYDAIPSLFLPDQDGSLKEYPEHGRDEIIERLPFLRKRFNTYKSFATATMDDIFPEEQRKGAQRLKATMLQSCYLRNEGGGRFTMIPLPYQAQVSVINGMIADDFDGDGNADILINGNDYGTEVSLGRMDALNGLLLKGNGDGNFTPVSLLQSGIYLPGNGKALVKLRASDSSYLVAGSQNREALKCFKLKRKIRTIAIKPTEVYALIKYKDGKTEKKEFYYGESFLSQSARFLNINEHMAMIDIRDEKGNSRIIRL